ncbi:16S rRNA (cytidine(1402)-2'-O)-methyltransferase [Candidatus Woesearchaeota archaeon]|nr:16S rRNA (cytidine(1402)-2'-O)-methyltransferase [Candidatus Woesearchaeota archaeon]
MLYLVSTPIGNLEDITFRAIRILKESGLILAEDTRRTGILLKKYNIENRMLSYNDTNKERVTPKIIEELKQGKDIALVTDSGTPGISDPGFYIVRECVKKDIKVSPVPGPNALISALICSGMPTDRFTFYGFIPKQESKKKALINQIKERKETAVLYESPHRISKTLKTMAGIIPEKEIAIARELTKKFEEIIRGNILDISNAGLKTKGELVLVIN